MIVKCGGRGVLRSTGEVTIPAVPTPIGELLALAAAALTACAADAVK
jgi:hypothetical protein